MILGDSIKQIDTNLQRQDSSIFRTIMNAHITRVFYPSDVNYAWNILLQIPIPIIVRIR